GAPWRAASGGAGVRALFLGPRGPTGGGGWGGARRNPTMMAMLARRANVEVVQAETLGWKGDAVEAECFAFLAVRVLRGLPISFPSTTGVPRPMQGGRLAG
ncbi:anhydro-N-acetylmuramic acid kinase, partial [Mesorhizobium sp. M1121]|uniref:anhydro-N-acetylmuramic acid kinase n=1 Tax=Mesorhizobium sp. M1121 TaxID=2957058 RepID=UPI0033386E1B